MASTSSDAGLDAPDGRDASVDACGHYSACCFALSVVPAWKTCSTSADCEVGLVQIACDGTDDAVGIARGSFAEFQSMESAIVNGCGGCGRPPGPTTADDGTMSAYGATPTVTCKRATGVGDGTCTTTFLGAGRDAAPMDGMVTGADGACVPKTCTDIGVECGPAEDGCGGVLNCGVGKSGSSPEGGAGVVCGPCIELCVTCKALGVECGWSGDGAGGVQYCGECAFPKTCGGGGVPGQCGSGYDACVPHNCANEGAYCGTIGDGCGGFLNCGTCPAPLTCGGKRPGACG